MDASGKKIRGRSEGTITNYDQFGKKISGVHVCVSRCTCLMFMLFLLNEISKYFHEYTTGNELKWLQIIQFRCKQQEEENI